MQSNYTVDFNQELNTAMADYKPRLLHVACPVHADEQWLVLIVPAHTVADIDRCLNRLPHASELMQEKD